jgi:hypothetical protein
LAAWPSEVARWVNVADRDDLVDLRKDLEPYLRVMAGARFADGAFTPGIGLVLLSLSRSARTGRGKCCRWSASFLVVEALRFSDG